ncbi:MAG: LacI family DNA-binding transcriptional regulator [Firmicutes bacterium]|nr:LacI family DNA-binding transcriptional regulator [Bacillota bacterium]
MTTIYDVARQAGVSVATVSRVLNGEAHVAPETRQKVLHVVQQLGYRRNGLARGLATRATRLLAFLVPDISNPYFPEVARGVEDAANAAGYHVILCNTDDRARKEQEYLEALLDRRIDGAVIIPVAEGSRVPKLLKGTGLPAVLLDRDIDPELDTVMADNVAGARQAMRHLLGLGHRRIAAITGPTRSSTARERLEGYRQALAEHEIPFDPDLVVEGDFRRPSGYQGMLRLLDLPQPPTAVFAANDMMALGALHAAEERGVRVPEDLAVVGFDDIALAEATRPKLTTVAQPKYEMGRLGVELLLQRIPEGGRRGQGRRPQRLVLESRLVVRQSSLIVRSQLAPEPVPAANGKGV